MKTNALQNLPNDLDHFSHLLPQVDADMCRFAARVVEEYLRVEEKLIQTHVDQAAFKQGFSWSRQKADYLREQLWQKAVARLQEDKYPCE